MQTTPRALKALGLALCALLGLQPAAQAQTAAGTHAQALRLPAAVTAASPTRLAAQRGQVQVVVRLTDAPLAVALGPNAKQGLGTMGLAQRQAYMASLKGKQDALMGQIRGLGGAELARVSKSYNALVVSVPATRLPQIARLAGVTGVLPVPDSRRSLGETVPYVGAKALQDLGVTGAGKRIAVLDSGVDYTHRNLGGAGTAAAFAAAANNPTVVTPGVFPTAKVIGGYDFVGETWPNGALAPDPNPIDAGSDAGHGTHVADIAAGASTDGKHKGMAPGASIYAVKVCSSVSTSCSGVATLAGLDWAMDPNGDLDFSDAADVINLSLGADYGQREDSSSQAVSNLVRFGIVVVAAAGNAADRPYIVSSSSTAPEAISVAQTAVPSAGAIALVVNAPASIAGTYGNTNTVEWAPVTSGFSGLLAYGSTADARLSCTPQTTPDFTGKVALIDRGSCNISTKVANASAKGALGVLLANNAPGEAPTFSSGGETNLVQTLVIGQEVGARLKSALASGVTVTVSRSNLIPLVGSMASTSARGPSYSYGAIKPEIGAPGASVSAVYGTGTGTESFGGTSGATPMVAGAAALLLQKFPAATPVEIKARLMNGANAEVYTNPATLPGVLAPVSRIGAGELRVDKSATLTTGVWDATNPYSVGLSFGVVRATGISKISRKVAVRNYSNSARTYAIQRSFRYAADEARGAVTLAAPASITVPANATAAFVLTLTLDAGKLPAWNLGFAGNQGNGALLGDVEFDGYVTLSDSAGTVSVPWHILPHKAANVLPSTTSVALEGESSGLLGVSNVGGAAPGYTDVFALTGISPQISVVQAPAGGEVALIDLKATGVRLVDVGVPALQFAITTFGRRAHPAYPAEFDVYVDVNGDGVDDAVIYTAENGGFGTSGQTLVYAQRLNPDGSNQGQAVANFYLDADLDSSNAVLTVLASDLGVTNLNSRIRFDVLAFDNYYSGALTDVVVGNTYIPARPKYSVGLDAFTLPAGRSGALTVTRTPGVAADAHGQSGLLMLHWDARAGREADLVQVAP
ncbi:S8 family serine peptidase [Aquincola tertiaricarbonis]|uniref:S8 family serine peptidase n=1 Tax=Aquincola tertiaricarbonis TaxID=391953 RepID=UPI000614A0A3|nr:S8 family serine peptidase [Aquincola tertiaricarbonis]